MAERTLAEAVAELRLSDRKIGADLASLRRQVLTATQTLEQDARLNIGVKVDDDAILEEFIKLEQITADFSPTAKLTINSDDALADLAALRDIAEPISLDVQTQAADDEVKQFAQSSQATLTNAFGQAGEQSGSQFAEKLKGAIGGISSTIGLVAGGFLAGALVKGFERLTTIRDSTAQLTVALGDASKAATLLDQVLGVVRGTPFNLDQFASAAANMVSFGIEAQKVPGYLTAIGEAAATRGSRANEFAQRLSTVFGQITSAGKIGGEELNQFSEAGVDALRILANQFGKTSVEMRKMISDGAVPAGAALDALADGILNGTEGINGATNAFAGTMAALRDTLTGSIGGFSAATSRFGLNIIEPFEEALIAGFTGISGALDKFGGQIKESLSGIADSDFLKSVIEFFKELPDKIETAKSALGGLGPSLAPLLAFLGASGLGQLQSVLGTFGKFIPDLLTKPIFLATAAFALFTPEVREALIPLGEKLLPIFTQLAAVVTVTATGIIDNLVPVVVKLISVAESLVPLVGVAVDLASVLTLALVPAIGFLADVVGKIPVGVIKAAVAAFLAWKVMTASFAGPLTAFGERLVKFGVSATNAGKATQVASKAMAVAGNVIVGAFAGMALASEDTSTKVTGAIGAIGAVAVGFAAGPIVGTLTAAGVAIGYVAGLFVESKKKAQEFEKQLKVLSDAFAVNTREVLDNAAALETLIAKTDDNLNGGLGVLGQKIIEENKKLGASLFDLGLPSTGVKGGEAFIDLVTRISAAKGDLSGIPEVMDDINDSFTKVGEGGLVAKIIGDYKSFDDFKSDLKSVFDSPLDEKSKIGAYGADLVQLADLTEGKFTPSQEAAAKALITLGNAVDDADIGKLVKQTLQVVSATDEQGEATLRLALKRYNADKQQEAMAAGELDSWKAVTLRTLDAADAVKLYNLALEVAADKDGTLRAARIDGILEEANYTKQQIADLRRLAGDLRVDMITLVTGSARAKLDEEFGTAADKANVLDDVLQNLPTSIDRAKEAAGRLSQAANAAKEAFANVKEAISGISAGLSSLKIAQDFTGAIRGISKGFSRLLSDQELGIEKVEEAADRSTAALRKIRDEQERIADMQKDVDESFADAELKKQLLTERLAEAQAAGATRGARLLQRELDNVYGDANDKKEKLDRAIRNAAEDAADAANGGGGGASKRAVVSLLDQLRTEAKSQNVSLLDLLLSGNTELSQNTINTVIGPTITTAQAKVQEELEKNGAPAAQKLAETLKAQVAQGFIDGGLDPETSKALVASLFTTDALDAAVVEVELALKDEAAAKLYDAIVSSFAEGEPIPVEVKTFIDAADAKAKLQENLDKQEALKEQLELVLPTSDEAKILRDRLAVLLAEQETLEIPVNLVPYAPTIGGDRARELSGADPGRYPTQGPPRKVFKDGGFWRGEDHRAQIVSAGTWRQFGEPETHGEGYIPLSPFKREGSTRVLTSIADMFGLAVIPKDMKAMLPSVVSAPGFGGMSFTEADMIGAAVARHTKPSPSERAQAYADRYDAAMTIAPGAIVIQESGSPRRTARKLVSELSEMAWRR